MPIISVIKEPIKHIYIAKTIIIPPVDVKSFHNQWIYFHNLSAIAQKYFWNAFNILCILLGHQNNSTAEIPKKYPKIISFFRSWWRHSFHPSLNTCHNLFVFHSVVFCIRFSGSNYAITSFFSIRWMRVVEILEQQHWIFETIVWVLLYCFFLRFP